MKSLRFWLTVLCFLQQHSLIFGWNIDLNEAKRITIESYIYGYSLVTSEVTRVQMTVAGKNEIITPMGVFNNLRAYPPADYHGVVAPNADTLYSIAWIDLNDEPWFFSHPDMNDRYYLFPIYTLWMSIVDDPGLRTTGSNAATYALVGPNWNRPLPAYIEKNVTKIISSNTRYVVILGRTYCNGTDEDYDIVHRLQDQYSLQSLSQYMKNKNMKAPAKRTESPEYIPDPPFNITGSVRDVIKRMNISTYFNIMAARMNVSINILRTNMNGLLFQFYIFY